MRNIVMTKSDRRNLEAVLSSEFANVIGPLPRLDDLRAELQRAQIVSPDEVSNDVVTMNSTVVLRDLESEECETYTLVFPQDADIAAGRLSVLAPIGTAILGEKVDAEVLWRVPGGWRRLRIDEIVYQPERETAFPLG